MAQLREFGVHHPRHYFPDARPPARWEFCRVFIDAIDVEAECSVDARSDPKQGVDFLGSPFPRMARFPLGVFPG